MTITDMLTGFVGFIREAGFLGLLVAFLWALYARKLHFDSEFEREVTQRREVETERDAERARNVQLSATVERLSRVLETATGGFERSVAQRIAHEEGVNIDEVLAELATKRVGPNTRLSYPIGPVKPARRKARPDREAGAAK